MSEMTMLWVAVAALTFAVFMLLIQIRELRRRLRTTDDGVWVSNQISHLLWRIEQLESQPDRSDRFPKPTTYPWIVPITKRRGQ